MTASDSICLYILAAYFLPLYATSHTSEYVPKPSLTPVIAAALSGIWKCTSSNDSSVCGVISAMVKD
jgi:hypothetical protein